jgi:hypothetical protein
MKMKMALMAGALALSMVGQASAAIVSGATGSSSLVLSIWDTTSLTSYTTTLGDLSFSSFAAGVTGTSTTLTASGAAVGNQTFAADALLTSYLSGVNMATTVWNVQAVDNAGAMNFGLLGIVTTTNANIKSAANSLASVQSGTQTKNAIGNVDGYYTAVGATTPATFTSASAAAYAGTGLTTNAKTALTFNSTATIGSTLNFWYLTPSAVSGLAKASVAQFQGVGQAATWSLASNGDLTYTVGAVPEPGEWLLMLSGLCLIGFIATRRKNEGSMTFA